MGWSAERALPDESAVSRWYPKSDVSLSAISSLIEQRLIFDIDRKILPRIWNILNRQKGLPRQKFTRSHTWQQWNFILKISLTYHWTWFMRSVVKKHRHRAERRRSAQTTRSCIFVFRKRFARNTRGYSIHWTGRQCSALCAVLFWATGTCRARTDPESFSFFFWCALWRLSKLFVYKSHHHTSVLQSLNRVSGNSVLKQIQSPLMYAADTFPIPFPVKGIMITLTGVDGGELLIAELRNCWWGSSARKWWWFVTVHLCSRFWVHGNMVRKKWSRFLWVISSYRNQLQHSIFCKALFSHITIQHHLPGLTLAFTRHPMAMAARLSIPFLDFTRHADWDIRAQATRLHAHWRLSCELLHSARIYYPLPRNQRSHSLHLTNDTVISLENSHLTT